MDIAKDRNELILLPLQTLSFDEDDTVKSFDIDGRGLIHTIVMTVPNFTNVVTATLTVTNQDGVEIYNSTAKAKNATYALTQLWDKVPIVGFNTVKVTLSGAAGGTGGDVTVSVYMI